MNVLMDTFQALMDHNVSVGVIRFTTHLLLIVTVDFTIDVDVRCTHVM